MANTTMNVMARQPPQKAVAPPKVQLQQEPLEEQLRKALARCEEAEAKVRALQKRADYYEVETAHYMSMHANLKKKLEGGETRATAQTSPTKVILTQEPQMSEQDIMVAEF